MDHGSSIELNKIVHYIADDMARILKRKERAHPRKGARGLKSHMRLMVSCGVMFCLLLTVSFSHFACGDERAREELSSIKPRLEQTERRLARLEDTTEKLARLEGEVKKLQESVTRLNRSFASKLKAQATQEKAISPAKKRYHVVRRGESLFRIAKRYGLSISELCRLNQISSRTVIRPGQKLLVSKAPGTKP